MTLVIAGYDYTKSIWGSSDNEPMEVNGLFVVADSAISSSNGGRTLLNGFQKIYPIEAKLWKPCFFPDGSFNDYLQVHETSPLFIAFAGSTLTAQHILNSIKEHVSKLHISYTRNNNGFIEYNVIRHCENNPLSANSTTSNWSNDCFLDIDFKGLLTGEVIANVIEFSMNNALLSASKYKLDIEEFNAMKTELIAGLWCQSRKCHELYVYRMQDKPHEDGGLIAYTEKFLLPENEVAVIGMRNKFERMAKNIFLTALSSCIPPTDIMYKFLNDSIDTIQKSDSKEIAKPSFLVKFNHGEITTKQNK